MSNFRGKVSISASEQRVGFIGIDQRKITLLAERMENIQVTLYLYGNGQWKKFPLDLELSSAESNKTGHWEIRYTPQTRDRLEFHRLLHLNSYSTRTHL